MLESLGITKPIQIHPEGDELERHFTKNLHCQPFGGARRKVRGSIKSVRFILSGPWKVEQNSIGIPQILLKYFSLVQTGGMTNESAELPSLEPHC